MGFLQSLDDEIATQERILESHPAYIKLKALRAARSLYVNSAATSPVAESPAASENSRGRSGPLSGKSLDALNAAIEILRERGSPMRTAELLPLIDERGIRFAAIAPQNVLSSLLSRSSEIVSKGRSIGWALAEWNTAGGVSSQGTSPPADSEPGAQGREAGPGGGT
jgi:hypothetical protein